eukprot:3140309-Rhodomonas_salina.1
MGTWGIKLQSTLEKAWEKDTLKKFRSAKFGITSGTTWERVTCQRNCRNETRPLLFKILMKVGEPKLPPSCYTYPLASYQYFGVGSQSCTLAVLPVHQSGRKVFRQ